jgi:hypothetical protein
MPLRNTAMRMRNCLSPHRMEISQITKYVPESIAGHWDNTWHLAAATAEPAPSARYLAVLIVRRKGQDDTLPVTELIEGRGAVGARLKAPDGSEDMVGFRTDGETQTISCGGIDSAGRVFAKGTDKDGRTVRSLTIAAE